MMSRSPVPQVSANWSRSLRISLVGYSGSLSRLKLKETIVQGESKDPSLNHLHSPCAGSRQLIGCVLYP